MRLRGLSAVRRGRAAGRIVVADGSASGAPTSVEGGDSSALAGGVESRSAPPEPAPR
jgi:hypothetical protein